MAIVERFFLISIGRVLEKNASDTGCFPVRTAIRRDC
jgi:hypothetical protein